MRRLSTAFALSAALLAAGGCTDRFGRVDYGRTALLGVGVGAAAALTAGALSDNKPRPYHRDRGRFGYGGHGGGFGGGGYRYGPPRSFGYGGGYYPSRGYYGGW